MFEKGKKNTATILWKETKALWCIKPLLKRNYVIHNAQKRCSVKCERTLQRYKFSWGGGHEILIIQLVKFF